jgi:class 3 adenylate cyclase
MESAFPAGTVTFLFTDIEGSTRLWEQYPEGMQRALSRHDDLIRAAIEGHGGNVIKTTGDGFHAAFETGLGGVAAALSAQETRSVSGWACTRVKQRPALATTMARP